MTIAKLAFAIFTLAVAGLYAVLLHTVVRSAMRLRAQAQWQADHQCAACHRDARYWRFDEQIDEDWRA